jgi:hypothetical protein
LMRTYAMSVLLVGLKRKASRNIPQEGNQYS